MMVMISSMVLLFICLRSFSALRELSYADHLLLGHRFGGGALLNQAFTGGAWTATMRMTTTALNTGVTAEGTPMLYMVVVMPGWCRRR